MEKGKLQQLLLHRRKAAQHAYRLLLSRNNRNGITLPHFRGLLRHVDTNRSISFVAFNMKFLYNYYAMLLQYSWHLVRMG